MLKENNFRLLKEIWTHFSNRRKRHFLLLLFLMIFSSLTEIVSLALVFPFLAMLTDPKSLFENEYIQPFFSTFNINSELDLLMPLTITFCLAILLAGATRLFQSWANWRVVFAAGSDLNVAVFRKTLYQPYSQHISHNSSGIINVMSSKIIGVIFGGILPVIRIISSTIILFSIVIVLFYIDVYVSVSVFTVFAIIYATIIFRIKRKLSSNSVLIAEDSDLLVKLTQEGLGNIRDIIIDGNQEVYSQAYSRVVLPLRRAQGNNQFLGESPRFILETIATIVIGVLGYWLVTQPGGISRAIPLLGTLAFGAQRMLPIVQQIFNAWSTLQGNSASLRDVLQLLNQPLHLKTKNTEQVLSFESTLKLENLGFRYNNKEHFVLQNINLTIFKGNKIGLIGNTGSGKSTMLDIIMGLLDPTVGNIKLDGVDINEKNKHLWRNKIAHVPQHIFLSDDTIEQNIALGIPPEKIDKERVKWAAKIAQIDEIIESWPQNYDTPVGERGIQLSGGQRQRIGIARALFKKSEILVLDEATSALDNITESEFMESLKHLDSNVTILIIAHRLTTLKDCDNIIEISNGEISRIGSYSEIIESKG